MSATALALSKTPLLPLDYRTAIRVAQAHVDQVCGVGEAYLLDRYTLTRSFGWVFFYESREFQLTGNAMARLIGNAPFLVDRNDGQVVTKHPRQTVDSFVAGYEQDLSVKGSREFMSLAAERGSRECPINSVA